MTSSTPADKPRRPGTECTVQFASGSATEDLMATGRTANRAEVAENNELEIRQAIWTQSPGGEAVELRELG
jgi:hypothetical protein